jgi:hypothetical protein
MPREVERRLLSTDLMCTRLNCVSAAGILLLAVLVGLADVKVDATRASTADEPAPATSIAEFWVDPGKTPRDLFWGSGGRRQAPSPDATYKFVSRDETGFSVSYDVTGPDDVEWSAKIGPEAQTEVVLSRILWGLGYHQPPLYYLPSWTVDGWRDGKRVESEARFRPKVPGIERSGYWKWAENPFRDRRELRGLLVVLLLLNSTDLKDDNNAIYELTRPQHGVKRWFVVRDLGASLGETGKLFPRRNWLEGFEQSRFITAISGRRVEFDYDGRHRELIETIEPADVTWAAQRLNRLTDRQWRDAFRAANYATSISNRYIQLIEQRIADGLALRPGRPDVANR